MNPSALIIGLSSIVAIAISWNVPTFYVLMGVLHVLLIPLGFRLLQVDPEHNGFAGGLIAAVIINVAAYFTRDLGVVGVMIVGVTVFGLLAAVTSGEVLKAFLMSGVIMASYGVVAMVLVPRTPLNTDDIAGLAKVVIDGGMKPEPLKDSDYDKLTAGEEEAK